MPLLPAPNNFGDLREIANQLQVSAPDDATKRLIGVVAALAVRCDQLEREVERHEFEMKSAFTK